MDSRFAMIPLAVISDNRLTLRMLKTFAAICSFRKSSDDFSVQAGRDEIAKHCGLHPSIISTATTELERLGWLVKNGIGGRSMKNTYLITLPETVALSETVTDSVTVSNSATVTESETVTDSVSKTVTDPATPLYRKEVNIDECVSELSAESNGFAEFWQQYPKKVVKSDALKAWRKLKPGGRLLADMMAALEKQRASADWIKDGGQFIPHPATWLNKRRWEDETQTAQSADAEDSLFAGAL